MGKILTAQEVVDKWALDPDTKNGEVKGDLTNAAAVCAVSEFSKQYIRMVVEAWESLPGGHHPPKIIEKWLINTMKPAIDKLRELK